MSALYFRRVVYRYRDNGAERWKYIDTYIYLHPDTKPEDFLRRRLGKAAEVLFIGAPYTESDGGTFTHTHSVRRSDVSHLIGNQPVIKGEAPW